MKPDIAAASKMMGKQPINPFGQCFDAVGFQAVLGEDPPADLKICHGIGIANMPGQEGLEIAHAWLEWGGAAYDCIWGVRVPLSVARKDFSYVVEYSRSEFLSLWLKHDFAGPWDAKIAAVIERNRGHK
jgi:hypothetical protein